MIENKPPAGENLSVGLVHHPVVNSLGQKVTTSVTTLDIHDMARICRTYGVGALFIVTPLLAQQTLVKRLVKHWREGVGASKNPTRKEALTVVEVVDTIDQLLDNPQFEEMRPLLITTGAKGSADDSSFEEVKEVIGSTSRVVLLFGTGSGLAPEVFERADLKLAPIEGSGDFNHLPVRSAAAIILDRLLGRL